MDILFNELVILLSSITVTVFLFYSIIKIRKLGIILYTRYFTHLCKNIVLFFGKLTFGLMGFLAASAKTSDDNDATSNAVRGGIHNHRTGKLDNGTDPAGWYEDD